MSEKIKIAIFEVAEPDIDMECYHCVVRSFTDWEEVTEEEYQAIRNWVLKTNSKNRNKRYSSRPLYQIICKANFSIKSVVEDYKRLMREEEEEKKKRQERARKISETRKKNKLERKRQEYLKLKEEFEGGV